MDVNNQPMHKPCATRWRFDHAQLLQSVVCHSPVNALRPDAVWLERQIDGWPGWRLSQAQGRPLRVGGLPARESFSAAKGQASCPRASHVLTVTVARAVAAHYFRMTACLGPAFLHRSDAEIRALLHSVRIYRP